MMDTEQDRETVQRLYLRLAAAISSSRRDAFEGPVTVAEIYQELVPYRAVRAEVGFSMNADYEHALLRLLSGEGGYARLEPGDAVATILKELQSPNPNVGLYRTYAGCDVWIAQPAGETIVPPPARPAVDWSHLDSLREHAPAEDDLPAAMVATPAPAQNGGPTHGRYAETAPETAASAPVTTDSRDVANAGTSCVFCDSTLPSHRAIRYCPFCGADQEQRPCSACGEAIEAGWAFCVACGATASH